MSDRLTAMDIQNQKFPRGWRGLDEAEVRLYLKSVSDEVERLNLENGEQRDAVKRLGARLEELDAREKALQDALVAAQRLSDDMVEKSRGEAELLLREARMKAERVLQQSQDQLARLEDEIGRLQLERDTFEARLRGVLEQHLELLDMRRSRQVDPDLRILRSAGGSDAG